MGNEGKAHRPDISRGEIDGPGNEECNRDNQTGDYLSKRHQPKEVPFTLTLKENCGNMRQ
jgi:hypothetical protein